MEDLTIAAIQMNAPCGAITENIERHRVLAAKAAKRGAQLVCFPELSISGHYVDKEAWNAAEPVPDGPSYRAIEGLARELGVFISAGIAEKRDGASYNTQFLTGPDGFIGKYSKTHASGDESFYFGMGTEFPVFDMGLCKVGILICYDIAFPEVARILALNGAEVILAPHASRCGPRKPKDEPATVRRQIDFFQSMGWARSNDNGVFMVMNNQAGDAGKHLGLNIVHGGGMMVTSPKGEVVAKSRTRKFQEEILVTTLEAKLYQEARLRSCHPLQTRRPAIYGRLARQS